MFTGRITNWKEVGGNDAPIVLVSRDSNSGTHVYFLEVVVRKGAKDNKDIFAPQTLLMPSSVGITSEISRNPNAIGYDGLGYVTEHEKVIAVAHDSSSPFVLPAAETAANGSYPLARHLYMYTAGEPTGAIGRTTGCPWPSTRCAGSTIRGSSRSSRSGSRTAAGISRA